VTHSHWDHFNDVPHIADTAKARVIGILTTVNLISGYQLKEPKVIASLHSRTALHRRASGRSTLSGLPEARPSPVVQ
jgi:hypothetical protein